MIEGIFMSRTTIKTDDGGLLEVDYLEGTPVKVASSFLTGITRSDEKGVPDTRHYDVHVHKFGPEDKDELGKFTEALIQAYIIQSS